MRASVGNRETMARETRQHIVSGSSSIPTYRVLVLGGKASADIQEEDNSAISLTAPPSLTYSLSLSLSLWA